MNKTDFLGFEYLTCADFSLSRIVKLAASSHPFPNCSRVLGRQISDKDLPTLREQLTTFGSLSEAMAKEIEASDVYRMGPAKLAWVIGNMMNAEAHQTIATMHSPVNGLVLS